MNYKRLIRYIQKSLSSDLLSSEQKLKLSGSHFTEGHCAVAAEAAFHLLGGKKKGWVAVVLPKSILKSNTHWWVENIISGARVDPTAEQFGDEPIPYNYGKRIGFMNPKKGRPSKRAKILINRVKKLQNG